MNNDFEDDHIYTVQNTTPDNSKLYAVFSYIWILWLIGLFAQKRNPFVRYHVNQGIILTIFKLVLDMAIRIFEAPLFSVPFRFNYDAHPLSFIGQIIILVFVIIGIINAARGQQKPLPIIGKLFTIIK